jgi:hypothetical protein
MPDCRDRLFRGKTAKTGTMIRTIVALLIVSVLVGTALADDARPSMPYSGMARMDSDGTITLQLTTTADGKPADSILTYKISDRAHDSVKRHIGLKPGDSKPFRPWKD